VPYRRRLRDAALADRLSDAARGRLGWAADVLDGLSAAKDSWAIDELIERLLAATGFEAVLLGQYQGHRKCGNVHRVLERARSAQAGGATLREFVDFVTELTVREVRAEQAATEAEAGDVVRIMTIHKAKGLEFPVVFLADLNYAPRPDSPRLGVRGQWGLTLRAGPAGREDETPPQSWALAKAEDGRKEAQEDLRTFYVAVTRHRDFIGFVGAMQRAQDGRLGQAGSMLRLLDDALQLGERLGEGRVELDDGAAVIVRQAAQPDLERRGQPSLLEELCGRCNSPESLAEALVEAPQAAPSAAELPYLEPVYLAGRERLAPTALSELEFCPACFRWHYELRVPVRMIGPARSAEVGDSAGGGGSSGSDSVDPAMAGTLFHRCMELLDFADRQPASALMARALQEQDLTIEPAALTAELEGMLRTLRRHELWRTLATARQVFRELEFVTAFGCLEVQGVIDVLVQDAAGRWRILDYKSDRVSPGRIAEHAARYELQMLIYAAAARRHLGVPDARPDAHGIEATLYFLRPGLTHAFTAEALSSASAERRLADLAERLAQCRRTGGWPGRNDAACEHCRYVGLCASVRQPV